MSRSADGPTQREQMAEDTQLMAVHCRCNGAVMNSGAVQPQSRNADVPWGAFPDSLWTNAHRSISLALHLRPFSIKKKGHKLHGKSAELRKQALKAADAKEIHELNKRIAQEAPPQGVSQPSHTVSRPSSSLLLLLCVLMKTFHARRMKPLWRCKETSWPSTIHSEGT